ncbi:MAG: hypothetical protein A4E32_02081 [Methanomassiliicoccales archaeon PtaU1.Bin124]|nr:MAG: hypothetical protein A4E32_02081 [Methanomassiliicoccales archaeon PtaU1.Bin124]
MIQLRNRNELASLLKKGLEIERGFENLAQWEGYVQAKSDMFRSTLFTMISESEHHATMVTEMLDRLDLPNQGTPPLRPQNFDFSTREEAEVMHELARNEKLVFDLYSNIRDSLIGSDTASWLSEEDREFMLGYLAELIEAEAEHMRLAARGVGKVERIR